MRFKIFVGLLSLVAIIVAGCTQSFQPGTLIDDLGREVKIDKPPQRIVSHVPSITEILFALGLDERVVGVDSYSDYPEAAKLKEKIGGFYNPSVEKIVGLGPDLVFTNGDVESLLTQLGQLGITYIVLRPKDMDGIIKNIELIGRVTDTQDKAGKLIKDMQTRISDVAERVKSASRPKVFYIIDATDLNNPWTAGPGSFIDALINLAGGENIGAKAPVAWAKFSIEEVINSDPQIIIADAQMGTAITSKEKLVNHPIWQRITAVKQDKVFIIDGDLVSRSGPRIVQGLEEMARMIHPELFK